MTSVGEGVENWHSWWGCKTAQPPWTAVWYFLKRLKMDFLLSTSKWMDFLKCGIYIGILLSLTRKVILAHRWNLRKLRYMNEPVTKRKKMTWFCLEWSNFVKKIEWFPGDEKRGHCRVVELLLHGYRVSLLQNHEFWTWVAQHCECT